MNASRFDAWPSVSEGARYRMSVASRVLAAAFGGYALTSALAVLLALLLPLEHAQAVVLGMNMGFLIAIPILLWTFHTRSAARAWGWLALWTAVVSGLCWWLMHHAGGAT